MPASMASILQKSRYFNKKKNIKAQELVIKCKNYNTLYNCLYRKSMTIWEIIEFNKITQNTKKNH